MSFSLCLWASNADSFLRIQDKKNTKERLREMLQLWLGHFKHGYEVQLIQKGWEDQIVYYIKKKCREVFNKYVFHAVTAF